MQKERVHDENADGRMQTMLLLQIRNRAENKRYMCILHGWQGMFFQAKRRCGTWRKGLSRRESIRNLWIGFVNLTKENALLQNARLRNSIVMITADLQSYGDALR